MTTCSWIARGLILAGALAYGLIEWARNRPDARAGGSAFLGPFARMAATASVVVGLVLEVVVCP